MGVWIDPGSLVMGARAAPAALSSRGNSGYLIFADFHSIMRVHVPQNPINKTTTRSDARKRPPSGLVIQAKRKHTQKTRCLNGHFAKFNAGLEQPAG